MKGLWYAEDKLWALKAKTDIPPRLISIEICN
jgi:hypothetical protein